MCFSTIQQGVAMESRPGCLHQSPKVGRGLGGGRVCNAASVDGSSSRCILVIVGTRSRPAFPAGGRKTRLTLNDLICLRILTCTHSERNEPRVSRTVQRLSLSLQNRE